LESVINIAKAVRIRVKIGFQNGIGWLGLITIKDKVVNLLRSKAALPISAQIFINSQVECGVAYRVGSVRVVLPRLPESDQLETAAPRR
jgi:hypothetical protein